MRAIVLVLLLICFDLAFGLSEGETRAIEDFVQEWPYLQGLSPPWSSNASKACDNQPFHGIECSDGPDKHIVDLMLNNLGINQHIPESIGEFVWLNSLRMNIHDLRGGIPSTLENLVNLTQLSITVQTEQKELPIGIKNMTRLQRLTIGGPSGTFDSGPFYGRLPSWFCDLEDLQELSLSRSGLSGFEECEGRLPKLQSLAFALLPNMSTQFETLVKGRTNLEVLRMINVPIEGKFELLGQTNLKDLTLTGTHLSGSLPDSLWTNLQLARLTISFASIGGTLPPAIGNLTLLQRLELQQLPLGGTLPPEIASCTSLDSIQLGYTQLTGTVPATLGNLRKLKRLHLISSQLNGSLPKALCQISTLNTLALNNNNFEGSIPSCFEKFNFLDFSVSFNQLNGTLPNLKGTDSILLQNNKLSGTIPESIFDSETIILNNNRFSGTIESALFNPRMQTLRLSNNLLEGSLPQLITKVADLDLSYNNFTGTIPTSYMHLFASSISLRNNRLEGHISNFLRNSRISTIDLSSNHFSGSIPPLISPNIHDLRLSSNQLTGSVPAFPPNLNHFSASNNHLSGSLDSMFSSLSPSSAITYLDLANNMLEGTLPDFGKLEQFSFLSLASNRFSGHVLWELKKTLHRLQSLDLSNNQFSGEFPFISLGESLFNLVLSNNSFYGSIGIYGLPSRLSVLDIANNQFKFDASTVQSSPYLSFILAKNNSIYGSLLLRELTSLQSADFAHNQITKVDFPYLSVLSTKNKLRSLYISNNNIVYDGKAFETLLDEGALSISQASTPSTTFPGVICSLIDFGHASSAHLEYDESIFSYHQCHCDSKFYGIPPKQCVECGTLNSGLSTCGSSNISVSVNSFIYQDTNASLKIEDCLSVDRALLATSNCAGIRIVFDTDGVHVFNSKNQEFTANSIYSSQLLSHQCAPGSSGRQCSKCDCDPSSNDCYFPGPGNICKRCEKVFSLAIAIPVSLVIILTLVAVLSIVFYLVLASKRKLKDEKWENLSLGSRIVYRLVHLSTVGQITIMLTFIQILIEATHWDTYALKAWLLLLNGNAESLGLVCLFPVLSSPMISLVGRFLLPFAVIGLICASIGTAELIHRLVALLRKKREASLLSETDIDTSIDPESETLSMIGNGQQKNHIGSVVYPASALATSTSISIIRFFYFATTMAVVEYLISSRQEGSGKLFVLSVPWMSYDDAHSLRMVSIPFLLVFLVGIPVSFGLVSWKFRHKIGSPFTRFYFGTLFENFRNPYFWWEMVNIMKKIVVALLLRWLSPNNSWQPFMTSLLLGSIGLVTMILNPWKLRYENIFEGIGSLLLILSLASGRLAPLTFSRSVVIFVLVLDVLYVISCLVIIIWRLVRDKTAYEIEWDLRFSSPQRQVNHHHYQKPLMSDDFGVFYDENGQATIDRNSINDSDDEHEQQSHEAQMIQ